MDEDTQPAHHLSLRPRLPPRRSRDLGRPALAALAAGAAMLLTACPGDVVEVGAVLPLTGPAAPFGTAVERGLRLALEEVKADGGYPHRLELEVVDSGSDPERAHKLLGELYEGGAIAVIGGVTSAEALAMVPEADRRERLLLSPTASSPRLSGISPSFYRVFPSDTLEVGRLALFATGNLGHESFAVLKGRGQEAEDLATSFSSELVRHGGRVLETLDASTSGDRAQLAARLRELAPDAVYVAGRGMELAELIAELGAGLETPVLTSHDLASPAVRRAAGPAAADLLLPMPPLGLAGSEAALARFTAAYQRAHGEPPDLYAAHGYDALGVLAEALRERTPIPSEAIKGLRTTIGYPGVTGSLQFDERGDVQKFSRVYVVADDLSLRDFGEERERRRRELREQIDKLLDEAAVLGGGAG